MIDCEVFYEALKGAGVSFFSGVPDSLLKEICACISDRADVRQHVIAANEGAAVALVSGNYLASGEPGLVYMQNSGLGNALNPLLSLADGRVYSIPMVLMIGWRGEPGVVDEPQHVKQGAVTLGLLETMGIPFEVIDGEGDGVEALERLVKQAVEELRPVAMVVKKGAFARYKSELAIGGSGVEFEMSREEAIGLVLDRLSDDEVVVSTTGMASREIFEYREERGEGHERDFLTVGSMGHCSQIALGIALAAPSRKVVCIDGDGALIMHMGALAIIGQATAGNLLHVVLNNGRHDSVGGQPTVALSIDLPKMAKACGYDEAVSVETKSELSRELGRLQDFGRLALLEIKVNPGARGDLGRPHGRPAENKVAFMEGLKSD